MDSVLISIKSKESGEAGLADEVFKTLLVYLQTPLLKMSSISG